VEVSERVEYLRGEMGEAGLSAFLVTSGDNRRYLSGFTGSSGAVVITRERAWLLTDFRYLEQARDQAPGFEIVRYERGLLEAVGDLLAREGCQTLGFEKEHVSFLFYQQMETKLKVSLVGTEGWVEKIRRSKNAREIDLIERAVEIADRVFLEVRDLIHEGVAESELALEIDYRLRKMGAEGSSFETIVASGPRSSRPHATRSARRLRKGDLVVIDFGAVYQGYCSDITRTVCIGPASSRQREVYGLVLAAQEKALETARPGMSAHDLDRVSREVIKEAGYGKAFGHGLGHGVGLAVHEAPRVAPSSDTVLEPGMVFSVEPGIYLPSWGGVRIEDLVVMEEDGVRVLTRSTKELLEF